MPGFGLVLADSIKPTEQELENTSTCIFEEKKRSIINKAVGAEYKINHSSSAMAM